MSGRRIALIFSVFILVFGLVACGEGSVTAGEGEHSSENEGTANEQTVEEETDETLEESAETGEDKSDAEESTGEVNDVDSPEGDPGAADEEQGTDAEKPAEQSKTVVLYYSDENLMELVEEEQDIHYTERVDLFQQLWEGLQSPEDEQHMSLWNGFELVDIHLEGSQLTIDVSKSEDVQFGSGAEGFALQTLLQTFGQVDDVQTIQLLVDGQVEETLGGHVSINEPLDVDEDIYTGE